MSGRYVVRCIGEAADDWKLLLCLLLVDFEELARLRERQAGDVEPVSGGDGEGPVVLPRHRVCE